MGTEICTCLNNLMDMDSEDYQDVYVLDDLE